jgi:hypothetical protein
LSTIHWVYSAPQLPKLDSKVHEAPPLLHISLIRFSSMKLQHEGSLITCTTYGQSFNISHSSNSTLASHREEFGVRMSRFQLLSGPHAVILLPRTQRPEESAKFRLPVTAIYSPLSISTQHLSRSQTLYFSESYVVAAGNETNTTLFHLKMSN